MGPLAAAVVSFAALTSAASIPRPHAKRQDSQLRDEYDFVVVGGGTSGLTVADRLTEAFPESKSRSTSHCCLDSEHELTLVENVLVIEYGDVQYGPGTFDPPTDWITPHPDAAATWSFNSLPNPDMANTTAFVKAGQVVGGSSAVNGMFFDRGSRFDYDAWTEVGGPEFEQSNDKWDWEGIFPFFKKVSADIGHVLAYVEFSLSAERDLYGATGRRRREVQLYVGLVCVRRRLNSHLQQLVRLPMGRPTRAVQGLAGDRHQPRN